MADFSFVAALPALLGACAGGAFSLAGQAIFSRVNREAGRLDRYEKHLDDALAEAVAAAMAGIGAMASDPSSATWNAATGRSSGALLMAATWANRCGRPGLEDALRQARDRLILSRQLIDGRTEMLDSPWLMVQNATPVLISRAMRNPRYVEGPTRNGRGARHTRTFRLEALLKEMTDSAPVTPDSRRRG